jgi:hypothetical protein
MIINEVYKRAAELIQGTFSDTLMGNPRQVLQIVLGRPARYEDIDNFRQYLEDSGIYTCNKCNWWTSPGEGKGLYCGDCQLE